MFALLPFLALAPAGAGALTAHAAASTRPAECAAISASQTVWLTARAPDLGSYCASLARADTKMEREPKAALTAAEAAEARVPGRAAPQVAMARARLRLDNPESSVEAFREALARDRHSLDAPLAMHDLATALRRAKQPGEALQVYRRLLPIASLLPNETDQVRVLTEAAHCAMAEEGAKSKPHLDEAIGYLRQALEAARGPSRTDALLSLALALDRAGADRLVLLALSLESIPPSEAARFYRHYLESLPAEHPFAVAAKQLAERVERAEPPIAPGRAPRRAPPR